LDVVDPAGIGWRKTSERGREIAAYVGIGVFLDYKRGRGVAHEDEQDAVVRPRLLDELRRLARDLGEAFTSRLHHDGRGRNDLGRDSRDGGQEVAHDRVAPTDRQVLFMSFCNVVIMSTRRRQTFSMKVMTLLRSASLGNCSRGSSGLVAGGSGFAAPGSGRLCGMSSFLSATFSPCSRAISVSSAAGWSATAWQAQPTARRVQIDTWPVRPSSRR